MSVLNPSPGAAVRRPWLAVTAAALATFSVVTTEMLPVGLLTAMAADLGSATGSTGLVISLPALLAALFAPLVVLAAGGIDRRRLLCGLLALLVVANIASALAPGLAWMLAARVLVGLCMGGIWAVAGGLAARLVPAASVGLATSLIFGGVAAASVLGVPLGAWVGEMLGWRWAFGGMAALSGAVWLLLIVALPPLPTHHVVRLRQFGALLALRPLQLGWGLTLLLVAGHFAAFTFVRPLLQSVSGFGAQWIGPLLFGYGMAGIAGNFLVGMVAARHTWRALAVIAAGLLLVPLLFLAVGTSPVGGGAALLVWGLAYGGVSVGLMTWVMKAAPQAVEAATALYVALFNIGIGLGAWLGGQVIDRAGLTANLWCAAALAGGAGLLVLGMAPAIPRPTKLENR
ncbi:MFS transporter [Comamonas sp. 17RB]|uniref:MFS transporter n=1 Tax=Comamonas sp. 17RB TaxID=3047025 RepID=UPI0024B71082|nr:MFS transporter [Comamonas sp. 17RB]MDI9853918.1 MFS transporter [Comamonas sp. 17RB]